MTKSVRIKYELSKLCLIIKRIFGLIDRKQYRLERKSLKGRLIFKHSYHAGDTLKDDGIGIALDLSGFNSLAEVGRNLISTLQKTNIPFEVFDTEKSTFEHEGIDLGASYHHLCKKSLHYKKKILCTVSECYKEPEYENYITPFWEFESGIEWARPSLFEGCAGVITFSDFCYKYFKKISPGIPVYKVRYPFIQHWEITNSPNLVRKSIGLTSSNFVVFYHFDYNNCFERKNPEAVLEAFAKAFCGKSSAQLVIKANGFEKNQKKVKRLNNLAKLLGIQDQTHFINQHLSKNALMELINAADVYISLHRGEGLGLGMLEAMALAKPVIATNYGGNTEFMNKENSLLVDYTWMKPKNLTYKTYKKVEKWADPNVEQAATYLKELYENKQKAKELGQKAKVFVESYFNPKDFERDMMNIFTTGKNK